MPRTVKCGLIQCTNAAPTDLPIDDIKRLNIEKHLGFIEQAANQGVQILCMQEVFTTPYFCAEQQTRWYGAVEKIPDGPTVRLMQEVAKAHGMVNPGFWEKFYFRPGNLGYPAFDTAFARIGVYICYDRHFPEGARALGLNGAEIVFNPSATVAGLSEYLWRIEQPAHAVANGYFIGAINRVGHEQPWDIGEFYGQSYFCDPRGRFIAEAPRDQDALVVADLDLDQIREVRNTWQFFRDRRPDTYGALVAD